MIKLAIGGLCIIYCINAYSVESSLKGIIDLRAVAVNGENNSESYLAGDYGKYRYNHGNEFALGQLGLQYKLEWQNNWSLNVVGNGFADDNDVSFGITEAYVHFKGLPTESGWRVHSKVGLYYPKISLENVATAWSTPYTLTSSTLNNWIGEEFRNTGLNLKLDKLGKASNSPHSFSFDLDLFQNNDSVGAMISWHGWALGSRQTLFNETLVVQDFPARNGMLVDQSSKSDPFIELDNRWGINVNGQWRYQNKVQVNVGYYDNRAEKGLVENGQYTWTTSFLHSGIKYKFAQGWELIGQIMQGNTLMTSPTLLPVVDNDFNSQYFMLRKFWDAHHLAVRFEYFSVDDLDKTIGDNNNENGKAITAAYRYQLTRQSFFLVEYNLIDSHRPARQYQHQSVNLTEQQYQIAYRYYF